MTEKYTYEPAPKDEKDVQARLRQVSLTGDKDGGGKIQLKRNIGLFSAVAFIVGSIIGSGIFVSPKGVIIGSGSVALTLVIWSACGVLSILGALCYAELGSCIHKSGGDYAYMLEAFAPLHRTIGPIPAFLCAWTTILVILPAAFAVNSLTFAEYLTQPIFSPCETPESIKKILGILCILTITFANCFSSTLASRLQNFFTVAKLLACAIVIVAGVVRLGGGYTEHLATGFDSEKEISVSGIATGFYSALWAYDGWNKLNFITEEIINPSKNFPRAVCIGLPLVMFCYIFMNVAYLTTLSPAEIIDSEAVAVLYANRLLGVMYWIIPVLVSLSALGAFNGYCFTGARFAMVAAREKQMPSILSCIQLNKLTPVPATIFGSLIAVCMILIGDIFKLINVFGFASWMFYGTTMIALILMRFTRKDLVRPYMVPLLLPIIVLIISLFLVIAPIVEKPSIEFLFAFLYIMGGLLFYFPFVYYKKELKCMRHVNTFIQLMFNVTPSGE